MSSISLRNITSVVNISVYLNNIAVFTLVEYAMAAREATQNCVTASKKIIAYFLCNRVENLLIISW